MKISTNNDTDSLIISNKEKIMSWIIAISPILLQYHFVVSTYGLILLFVVYLFFIIIPNNKFFIDKDFLKLGIVILIQEILSMIVFNNFSSKYINTVVTCEIMCLLVTIGFFVKDKQYLYDAVKKVTLLCTLIIYIQFLLHNIFGVEYKPLILIPQEPQYLSVWISNRPSGFFTEPQTFCTFAIIVLLIALEKKEFGFLTFLSLGIVLTGSSAGILLLVAVYFYYLVKNKNISNKSKLKVFIVAIVLAIVLSLPIFSKYIQKISSVFEDFSYYSSARIANSYSYTNYLRLLKSWHTYFMMPLTEKILGIGINNFYNYINNSNVVFIWNNIWENSAKMAGYYSSAGGVFIECGLIAGLYYYAFLIKKYRNTNSYVSKAIIVFLFLQSLITQIFFNHIFLYYFMFYNVFLCDEEKTIKQNKD